MQEAGYELSSKIYLFQGLPKSDKMELIIQKAVELGDVYKRQFQKGYMYKDYVVRHSMVKVAN